MKLLNKLSIGILVMLIMPIYVNALGVSPAKTMIDFEPGLRESFNFAVYNTGEDVKNVQLDVRGELAEYVTLDVDRFSFSNGEEMRKIGYSVELPLVLRKTGENKAEIAITEEKSFQDASGSMINVRLEVVTELVVNVPINGKGIEAGIYFVNDKPDQPIEIYLPVKNIGSIDLNSVKADIQILEGNNILERLESEKISLRSSEKKEVSLKWKPSLKSGSYNAKALVNYDGDVYEVTGKVDVGNIFVEVLEVNADNFKLGEVVKLDVLVENKWNLDMEGVHSELTFVDNNGKVVSNIKSSSVNVPALSQSNLNIYWDTKGLEEGNYDASIVLRYAGRQSETKLNTELRKKGIGLKIEKTTNTDILLGEKSYDKANSFVLILIVIVLLNILWVRHFKEKKNGL
jgi:flagellar hook assembly protein FlgD